jgi:formylglycine-generating enzyme required for sulfatase activity
MGEDSRSAGIRFVEIPAGEFVFHFVQADSKGRRIDGRRKVLIPKPFEMSTYEVTQAQYEIVMGTNPSYFRRPVNPVEQVSWDDANEFCRRLSESPDEKAFGYSYRLPTEEEWEYACRAGSTTVFSFGDDEAKLPEFAWFADNSGANRLESAKLVATLNNDMFAAAVIENNGRPHAVGRRKPNLFGLFDMHGNVYEWCGESGRSSSAEKAYRAAVPDPAIRGGSWWVDPGRCQSAFRHTFNQAFRNADIGFRVVRERTTLSP